MTKTMKGMVERIKETNAEFAKASNSKKRVMIAEDVLKALAARNIEARRGSYTGELNDELWRLPSEKPGADDALDADLRSLMPALPPCDVCAKGALFMCTVARRDKITAREAADQEWYGRDLAIALGGIFSAQQLDDIEAAFENSDGIDFEWWRDANDRQILQRIMKNIIANHGTFVPETVERDEVLA